MPGGCSPCWPWPSSNVAHPTIRNRGTTVGSLVHADAAAEMPVVLKLLGGSVDVASVRGTRTIDADDLFLGPLESSVEHDEIAVSAYFPALPADAGVGFEEISRRHGDYAMCGVAAVVRRDGDAVVEARAGYLSVSDVPTVVDLTAALAGGITDESLAAAGEAALAELEPADDIHATAAYRAQLVRVLTGRVLRAAYDDAGTRASADRDRATATTNGEDEAWLNHSTTCDWSSTAYATTSRCRHAGCCPTRCGTTSASRARTSAASTESAVRARSSSTAPRCDPACCLPSPRSTARSRRSRG